MDYARQPTEYQSERFEFRSVGISDIAIMAYSMGKAPFEGPNDFNFLRHNNTAWFKAWVANKLAWMFDIHPYQVEFKRFDVFPANTPDGFYFIIEGRWYLVPEDRFNMKGTK